MATITWKAPTPNCVWSDPSNWDTTTVPTASDSVRFNALSTEMCIIDIDATFRDMSVAYTYTGEIQATGRRLVFSQGFSDDGVGGNRDYGIGLNFNATGSYVLHIGSNLGTVTSNSCAITFSPTNASYQPVLDDDYGCTFKSWRITSAGMALTGSQPTHLQGDSTLFYWLGSSTGYNQAQDLYLEPTSSTATFSITNGGSYGYHYGNGANFLIMQYSGIFYVPEFTDFRWATSSCWNFTCAESITGVFIQTGTINLGMYQDMRIYASANGSSVEYDTSNLPISMNILRIGSTGYWADFVMSFGSSTITGHGYDGTTYDLGTINFNTSTFINYNTYPDYWWVYGAGQTVNIGTFLISCSNAGWAGDGHFTSNGQPFYDIYWNGNLYGGVYLYDNILCNNFTLTQSPYLHMENITLEALGDVTIWLHNGGTLYMDDGFLIMEGNNKTLTFENNVSFALSPTPGYLVIRGTGVIVNDDNGVVYKGLTLDYAGSSVTFTHDGISGPGPVFIGDSPITYWASGATLTANDPVKFILTNAAYDFGLPGSYTINGNDVVSFILDTSSQVSKYIPSGYNYTGTGATLFGAYSGDATWQLFEDFNSTGSLYVATLKACSLAFLTNNYALKTSNFQVGCAHASGIFKAYYGSSSIDATGYYGTGYNTGTINQYFSTSTWTTHNQFRHGTNHTIDPGTSIIYPTGDIYTANKLFYDIYPPSTLNVYNYDVACHNFVTYSYVSLMAGSPQANHNIVASGDIILGGNTDRWMGGNLEITGVSGTILLGTGVFYNANNVNFIFSGSGNCTFTQQMPTSPGYGYDYGGIFIGPNNVVTHSTVASFEFHGNPPLTVGANSTYTYNSSYTVGFMCHTPGDLYSLALDSTLNGTGPMYFTCDSFSGLTTVPTLNYMGTGSISIFSYSQNYDAYFRQTGNLNIGSQPLNIYQNANQTARYFNYNTDSYGINCGAFGVGNVFSRVDFSFGNSIINIASYTGIAAGYVHGAGQYHYLQNSTWTCNGNWVYNGLSFMDAGTSRVTFTYEALATTSNVPYATAFTGYFYDVTCNAPSWATVQFGTDMTCHDLTLLTGNFSDSTLKLFLTGDARFKGTGSIDTGKAIKSVGNDATIEIASTISNIVSNNTDMTFYGTHARLQMDQDATFRSLVLAPSSGVRVLGSDMLNIAYTQYPLTINSNSTLTINSLLNLQLNTTGTIINVVGSPYLINGDSTLSSDSLSSGAVVSFPSINIGGTLCVALRNNSTVSNTQQIAGTFTTVGHLILNNTNSGTLTFKSQNYPITANTLSFGNSHSSGTFISDFLSGILNVGDVNPIVYNSGTNTIKFNRSTWNVSGNWYYPTNHTVTHGWDVVNFIGDSTVTSNNKTFNWVYINNPSKNLSLTDNFICREYKILNGNIVTNGNNINATGYYIEIMMTE